MEVRLDALAETLAGFGFGYVLTRRDDGRSHISAVYATVTGVGLRVVDAGERTRPRCRPLKGVPPARLGYSGERT